MTVANKLIIILLLFFAKTQVSQSQTYLTPIVGYEWNSVEPLKNYDNYFWRFHIPSINPKYRIKSPNIGFRVNRKLTPNFFLNTGILYSSYEIDAFVNTALISSAKMKFTRLRALIGLEHEVVDNFFLSGDLTFNHLYNVKFWFAHDDCCRNEKSRMQLGLQFGVAWHLHHIVLRSHYEYGFWNLKKVGFTATRPISGFGVSIGYQIEL